MDTTLNNTRNVWLHLVRLKLGSGECGNGGSAGQHEGSRGLALRQDVSRASVR